MFRRILIPHFQRAAAILMLAAGIITIAPPAFAQHSPDDAREIIEDWPDVSQKAANAMLQKYGEPDEATDMLLIWRDNGPWKRTIVYGYEIDHDFPKPHKDVLEQFINYDVPPSMFDNLAHYDGSVIAERTKGELSARCDREAANFLALNLANDIIEGDKTVEEARQAYGEAMKQMMMGNPPAMTQRLTFDPPENVNNSDEPIMNMDR